MTVPPSPERTLFPILRYFQRMFSAKYSNISGQSAGERTEVVIDRRGAVHVTYLLI